jgi:endosialidase-like protein
VNDDLERATEPTAVDGFEVLEKLAALPISTWNYKWDDPSIRHLGPMAQDFAAAFGLGEDDRKINLVDANGVVMVAIQALHHKLRALEATVAALEAEIAALKPGGRAPS